MTGQKRRLKEMPGLETKTWITSKKTGITKSRKPDRDLVNHEYWNDKTASWEPFTAPTCGPVIDCATPEMKMVRARFGNEAKIVFIKHKGA